MVGHEQMYAAGYGIQPFRSARREAGRARHAGGAAAAGRLLAVALLSVGVGLGLAVVAHGGSAPADVTVVVQPGDTLWSIAAGHYPSDDTRARVDDIERLNGLRGPAIEAGETLHLPG